VAVSTEGIRFDASTVAVTVPFDKIKNVEVAPYQFCCKTYPLLSVVTVHRELAPTEMSCCQTTSKFKINAICRGQEFADLVMALKDTKFQWTYEGSAATMSLVKGTELPDMSTKIANMECV